MTAVAYRGPLAPTAVGREAETVVLRGARHWRASGPVAPRPFTPARSVDGARPPARPVTQARPTRPAHAAVPARPVRPVHPSWAATGFGYPPPSAYPSIPVPPSAALVPAGLNAPLSGIFPVEVPPSSGFPLLDRAVARGRWALACEPETGRRAGHGR
jgi:hypothetical protein